MSNEANAPRPAKPPSASKDKIVIRGLDFYYGQSKALKDVTLSLYEGQVTAFIGPSGCGKSTLSARAEPHVRSLSRPAGGRRGSA